MSNEERPHAEFGEGATQLTVRDRMNHAFLLANGVMSFQKTTTNAENAEAVVRETIMALYDIIPDIWEDEEFNTDIEAARIEQLVDVRPSWCGIPATEAWCQENGVPTYQKTVLFSHHLLMKACINLLERRGMLTRKIFKEIFTGKRFKGKGQDVAVIMDEIAQTAEGY